MTLATLGEVLRRAEAGRFCAAGFVVQGWEDARAYVEAAEETDLPILLQAGPGARRHTPVAVLGKMMRILAEGASVPVACHIDHAYSLDECMAGLDEGFTSVMIDGSARPLDDNIELTCRVVELARRHGASVEGQNGNVGYADGRPSHSTAPEEARTFVEATQVDALAISVGNVHLSTTAANPIDFVALAAIEAVTPAPLVLHGGSGISAPDRRRLAAQTRVRKLNIGTELRMAFGRGLRHALAERPQVFDRIEILNAAMPEVRAETVRALRSLCAE